MDAQGFGDFVGMMSGVHDELTRLRTMAAAGISVPASNPNQDELVATMAGSYQLPVVIVRAMVAHESVGGVTHAARFEPDFYERYIKNLDIDFRPEGCSQATERIHRATSWGLMQVMGQTARERGFRGWFAELTLPEVGLEWGCRYLRWLVDRYMVDGDWPTIMRAYNGGPGGRHKLDSPYPGFILQHIPCGVWPE